MTNSTDNKTEKKNKKKGPIRFEAVIPAIIVGALLYLYGIFFFDGNLRSAMAWGLGYVHGAEVNVAKVETSFFNGYFRVYGIQVTDKEEPSRNLIKIGYINFDLLWDALLRAKFVVDAAEIKNIEAYSKRRSPGWVKPPSIEEDSDNSAIKDVERNVLKQAQNDYDSNILGDISSVMSGTKQNDQVKKMTGDLKAEKRAKELEAELKAKSAAWDQKFAALPKPEEIEAIAKQIQNHKVDTKNVIQGAKDLQKLNKLIKEGKKKVDAYNKASRDLKADVKNFENEFKNLEKLAQDDLKSMQKRLKIPDVNTGEFTKKIFTRMIMEKLAGYKKYIEVGKQYMPPPKTAEEKAPTIVPRKRGQGQNVSFPITRKGYPLFWLKKAEISSKATPDNEYSGNVSGRLINFTSHPKFLGKPAKVIVKGEFPGLQITGIDANLVIDNTKAENLTLIDAKVASFPVGEQMFSNSKSVKFGYKSAVGTNITKGESRGGKLNLKIDNSFGKVDYVVAADNKDLNQILTKTTQNMPNLTLNAKVGGSWSNIKLGLDSNLGRELSRGVKKQIQARIDAEKKKLEDQIMGPFRKQQAKLKDQFGGIKKGVDSKVDGQKKKFDQAQASAQNSLNQKKKSSKKSGKKQQKKLLKDLKKKFKL